MTWSANISASDREAGSAPGRILPYRSATVAPGQASLRVIARQDGRSVVSRAFATSPLRLLTPTNHGRAAWVYTSSYGGGLVDGDHIALDIDVGPGAAALVSTQASTKVYRSERGATSDLRARVADEGLLVVMPDPVVCFASSRYRQTIRLDLAASAGLALVDWLSSGRCASGERWAFHEYTSKLVARVDGKLVVHDALALRAGDGDLAARLGRFDVLAFALLLGTPLRSTAAAIVSDVSRLPIRIREDLLVAASPLGDGGCLLRLAGRSVEEVGSGLRRYLAVLPSLLEDDPWARKW
jgi:urease accessory protein